MYWYTFHFFIFLRSFFFYRHWQTISSFRSSGQSRVRVVHFGWFALPQFVSKTAWHISRPECFNHGGWPDDQPTAVSWNCEKVSSEVVCRLLKLHNLQCFQKMRMKLKFRATGRMGFHSQHRLDVEGPEASMVNFYGLLEVKMFFFPEIEYTKKMLWKMISPSNLAMFNFIWVTLLELDLSNWWVCGTIGSFAKISQVPTFVGRLLVEKLRSPPFSWHQKAPPFFFGSRDSEGEWIFKRYLHGDLLGKKNKI